MKATLPLILLALLLSLGSLYSEERAPVPPIVGEGFEQLRSNGSLAAMAAWFAGSSKENDDDQDRAAARLNNMQSTYGRFSGYEILRSVPLTASTERVYAAVKFEKGVAWISFDCYRPGKDWIVVRFDFATNANLVLPPNILGGQ